MSPFVRWEARLSIRKEMLWFAFNFVASLCSIAGIVALFFNGDRLNVELFAASIVFISIIIILLGRSIRRKYGMKEASRDALIDTGKNLIRGTRNKVIMFAGDMTWLDDYSSVIREISAQGKRVEVIHRKSSAEIVKRNAEELKRLGALCTPMLYPTSLRGMFIDPDDSENGYLFVTDRRLRPNAQEVEIGEKSRAENYRYFAKIYYMSDDPRMLDSVREYAHFSFENRKP